MRTVLFFRRLRGLTGGHLKVRDYFGHVLASGTHTARIWFTPDSVWDESNPWRDARQYVVADPAAVRADVLFLAGMDWEFLPAAARERSQVPIVNFVQHVRHAAEGDPRRPFLRHRAIRVCVSGEVADAVAAAGANGPVVAIPNAIDTAALPAALADAERDADVVVVGLKQPDRARGIAVRLARAGRRVVLLDTKVPRAKFLGHLRRARVALCLPNPTEGFYLPALEAMALGTVVVVPDCVGNRSFCVDDVTCIVPPYEDDALVAATECALALDPAVRERLRGAAQREVAKHSPVEERRAFLDVLARADELWATQ